jgi:hypothetical protein
MEKKNILKAKQYSFFTLLVLFIFFGFIGCTSISSKKEGVIKESLIGKKLFEIKQSEEKVLEDNGILIVIHGSACDDSDKPGEQDHVTIKGSSNLPQYVENATIFINGWYAKYLVQVDRHFGQLLASITDIQLTGSMLTWKATGSIAEKDFDTPFKWCYYYTVVGWNSKTIDAVVDHKDGQCSTAGKCSGNINFANSQNQIPPISFISSYAYNKTFASKKQVAILPRGFNFSYLPYFKTDKHLLQIAYNFDHSEKVIENPKHPEDDGHLDIPPLPNNTSRVGTGYVSWDTQTILKDNRDTRDYRFWEMFSAIGGNDVGIIVPPLTIRPRLKGPMGCISYSGGIETVERIVENIPFEYAIPVLSGWSLFYQCANEHVEAIGIWIHDVKYDKNPSDPTGTLRYKISSILVDKDWKPGHHARHKVNILGLVGTTPPPD